MGLKRFQRCELAQLSNRWLTIIIVRVGIEIGACFCSTVSNGPKHRISIRYLIHKFGFPANLAFCRLIRCRPRKERSTPENGTIPFHLESLHHSHTRGKLLYWRLFLPKTGFTIFTAEIPSDDASRPTVDCFQRHKDYWRVLTLTKKISTCCFRSDRSLKHLYRIGTVPIRLIISIRNHEPSWGSSMSAWCSHTLTP